jgi:hypothetical protein
MEGVNGGIGAVTLVKKEFNASLAEMKALPKQDREELATLIAKRDGLKQEDCSFVFVS